MCRPSPSLSLARSNVSNVLLSSSANFSFSFLSSAARASLRPSPGPFSRAAPSPPVGRSGSLSRERPSRFADLFAVISLKHLSLLSSTSANRFRSSLLLGGAAWGSSSPFGTAPLVAVGVTSSPSRRPLAGSSPIPNASSSRRRCRRLSFSWRPAPSPLSLSLSPSSIVASSPFVSSAMLWSSALAARCRWAAVSCAARLTSSRGCPFRSGPAGGSPRWLFGGTEGCRCRRASELPPRTGFGAKCDYSRCRCSIAARFSLRGRVPVCSLLSTARSRARQIAVSVRSLI